MDLVTRLGAIVESEGIRETELGQRQMQEFLRLHGEHGGYYVDLFYMDDHLLAMTTISCSSGDLTPLPPRARCVFETKGHADNPMTIHACGNPAKAKKIELIDKLRFIAGIENLTERDFQLEEANFFWEEHRLHGGYRLGLAYKDEKLWEAYLQCQPHDLEDENECRHQNLETSHDFCISTIYCAHSREGIELQRNRRNAYNN